MKVRDILKNRILAELQDGGFTWDPKAGRYRSNATGRFISEKRILEVTDSIVDGQQESYKIRLERLTERMIEGKISLQDWQDRFGKELKSGYITTAMLGRGGKGQMTLADYGRLGARLQFEYRHLNKFAEQIKAGEIAPGQIRVRTGMYANGIRTAYFDGQREAKKNAGVAEERRVLNPAEHCEDCIAYAERGWQPLGILPPPGIGSACGHNCKCEMEYRTIEEAIQQLL